MKQETKNTINWIKECLNANSAANDKVMLNKAIKLLDSLPKLEARLLKGGYIPDRNGTLCKDGDAIRVLYKMINASFGAVLHWNEINKRFEIVYQDNNNTYIISMKGVVFEKVKDGSNNN